MTGLTVRQSVFESDTGNWRITATIQFSNEEVAISEEQAEKGANVTSLIRRSIMVVVTPQDLADTLGIPVEELDNITNAQLQAGVRGSALSQAMAILIGE